MCLVVCHDRMFRDPAVGADLEVGIQRPVPDFACAGLPPRAGDLGEAGQRSGYMTSAGAVNEPSGEDCW